MLTVTPAATRHHSTGELIHDHRFTVTDDVVHILNEQLLGLESVGDVMSPGVLRIKQINYPKHLLSFGKALISKGAAPLLFINLVITFGIDAVFA